MNATAPPAADAAVVRPNGFVASQKWKLEVPDEHDMVELGTRNVEKVYEKVEQIGEGTYGTVFKAVETVTKDVVALKRIRMDNEKEGFPITAIREIKILGQLDHLNVIRLREIVRSQSTKQNGYKGSVYMVFDYMDHDLTGMMERRNYKFTEAQIKCYMKQLLHGITYCHGNNVLHRDLKASNLLLNNGGILKIADFGLARTYKDDDGRLTNRVITLWYRPPELLLGQEQYGPEIDVWSIGCIFAELLTGKPLFPGKDEADQLDRIAQVLGSPTEETLPGCTRLPYYKILNLRYKQNRLRQVLAKNLASHNNPGMSKLNEQAMDLLEKLLCLDPKKRITALEASQHDYFWTEPRPCAPEDMPKFEPSHELNMKQKRKKEREDLMARQVGGRGGGYDGHDAKRARVEPHGGLHAAATAQHYAPHGVAPSRGGQAYPPAAAAAAYNGRNPPHGGARQPPGPPGGAYAPAPQSIPPQQQYARGGGPPAAYSASAQPRGRGGQPAPGGRGGQPAPGGNFRATGGGGAYGGGYSGQQPPPHGAYGAAAPQTLPPPQQYPRSSGGGQGGYTHGGAGAGGYGGAAGGYGGGAGGYASSRGYPPQAAAPGAAYSGGYPARGPYSAPGAVARPGAAGYGGPPGPPPGAPGMPQGHPAAGGHASGPPPGWQDQRR